MLKVHNRCKCYLIKVFTSSQREKVSFYIFIVASRVGNEFPGNLITIIKQVYLRDFVFYIAVADFISRVL